MTRCVAWLCSFMGLAVMNKLWNIEVHPIEKINLSVDFPEQVVWNLPVVCLFSSALIPLFSKYLACLCPLKPSLGWCTFLYAEPLHRLCLENCFPCRLLFEAALLFALSRGYQSTEALTSPYCMHITGFSSSLSTPAASVPMTIKSEPLIVSSTDFSAGPFRENWVPSSCSYFCHLASWTVLSIPLPVMRLVSSPLQPFPHVAIFGLRKILSY